MSTFSEKSKSVVVNKSSFKTILEPAKQIIGLSLFLLVYLKYTQRYLCMKN